MTGQRGHLRVVTGAEAVHPLESTMTTWNDGRLQRQEIGNNTWRAGRAHTRRMVEYFGPDVEVASITEAALEDWLGSLQVGPRSRNMYFGSARGFFGWALRRGIVESDPTVAIKNARCPDVLPRRVKASDVERVLATADFRARVLIALAVGLGLRRAELAALRVEDFDRDAGTLLINGKGSRQRVVPVEGEPLAALTAWLADGRTSGPLFPAHAPGRGSGRRRAATYPAGEPPGISSNTVGRLILQASQDAGLRFTPHQLRHTCAYQVLDGGATIEHVRRLLGHASIDTTGRYLAANVDDIRPWVGNRSYYQGSWAPVEADRAVADFG